MKITFKKTKIYLLAFMASVAFLQSCSKDDSNSDPQTEEISEINYEYRGVLYSEADLEKENESILTNSYQVYNEEALKISIFDTAEEADNFAASISDEDFIDPETITHNRSNSMKGNSIPIEDICDGQKFMSFNAKLFENKNLKGKFLLYIKNNINVTKKGTVKIKLPKNWKKRISSLKIKQTRAIKITPENNPTNSCQRLLANFDLNTKNNKAIANGPIVSDAFADLIINGGDPSNIDPKKASTLTIKDLSKTRVFSLQESPTVNINNKLVSFEVTSFL